MDQDTKPVIVVSKCLGFEACRYNGQIISSDFVKKLADFVTFIPVCPEVEIGLGVPRDPIRIVMHEGTPTLFQPATEKDVTQSMHDFTARFFAGLQDVDGFILKNRSPSCGINDVKIYTGFEKPMPSDRGSGFFGGAVLRRFSRVPVEDEGRLTNFTIREHFLTRLYTLFRFRQMKKNPSMAALIAFHSVHKLLLLAYNQSKYREGGRIIANHEKKGLETVMERYETILAGVFGSMPKRGAIINTLQHAFGGFSDQLGPKEKRFFLNSLEEYRDERIPLSTLTHLIRAWALRFDTQYLLEQLFFNPYPSDLAALTDSGKGRV
ncbi:DUF523 and DUF1722 domain-containing protein [bacterium]|nr:DUF523 and DUF1722 domain-containing protein [bacterium]